MIGINRKRKTSYLMISVSYIFAIATGKKLKCLMISKIREY